MYHRLETGNIHLHNFELEKTHIHVPTIGVYLLLNYRENNTCINTLIICFNKLQL